MIGPLDNFDVDLLLAIWLLHNTFSVNLYFGPGTKVRQEEKARWSVTQAHKHDTTEYSRPEPKSKESAKNGAFG